MALGAGIQRVSYKVQEGVQVTFSTILVWWVKFMSALFLGFTFSLIIQEIMQFRFLGFLFALTVATSALLKVMQRWSLITTIVFDLIWVLVGLALKMYILLAP
ncbi:MAG: hypothetical protein C5B49_12435 [Bdellovibrio sp.]|nr:MAG: hypothetical protein C5B49_12435 [Bdellovibrio sp.]